MDSSSNGKNTTDSADRGSKCCSKIQETLKISPRLLQLKAHYFFSFGSLAGILPPMTLRSKQLGASMSLIGVLFAVQPFAQFLVKPITGALADKFQQHRFVFLASIVVVGASFFSLNFIPKVEVIRTPVAMMNGSKANVTPPEMMGHWETPLKPHSSANRTTLDQQPLALSQNVVYTETLGSSTLQFVWLLFGLILGYVAYGVTLSISDTILLNVLGDDQSAYGTTRLFSSVGWGVISPIAAQIIEWTNEGVQEENKDYSAGFYVFLVLVLCDLAVSIPLKVVVPEKPETLARNVVHLLANPNIVVFLVACLFQGMIIGFTWTFEVIYANELNGNQLIIGLVYAVQCICSEIPMFLLSGWMIRKLGHSYTLSLVLFVTGLKGFLYSFVPSAWYLLLPALIHGFTYGTFYTTLATYASIVAPPGASATLQGIFQGVFEGAGIGLGILIGGVVYDWVGGRMAFRLFGSSHMIVSAIHLVVVFILPKIAALKSSSNSSSDSSINLKPVYNSVA